LSKMDFDRLLLEAIDEGLSTLGESSKQAIYFHLEKGFNIRKEEIPDEIEVFARAVEKIFGFGANFLEILIMKRLYEKLGRGFRWHKREDFTFVEYIATARRSFLEKNRIKNTVEKMTQFEEMVLEG
jgi:hypothetical protein